MQESLEARVRAAEVYIEGHAEKLGDLNKTLEKTNIKLDKMINALTEVKTTQKVTHAIAGGLGSFIALIFDHFWKH